MPIDLTKEEMNLIASILENFTPAMNRQSMAGYLRITESILQKFQPKPDNQSKEGE